MAAVVIATTWIAFIAMVASIILYVLASKYSMKAGATEADQLKARQLGMAGFWVLVFASIFGLVAAITASCQGSLSMKGIMNSVAQRLANRGGLPVLG